MPVALPLKRLRAALGVSQRDMASRMGLTPGTVSGIESGDPKLSTLRRYAQALAPDARFEFHVVVDGQRFVVDDATGAIEREE